jgi:hypothetical protein
MKLLRIFALTAGVLACATVASANTIWNFNNVTFDRPGYGTNTVTGSFELNTGPSGLVTWDITVSGTNTQANHHYLFGVPFETSSFSSSSHFYVANFNLNPNVFLILDFVTGLTDAGGTVNLSSNSLVCPGCGTLVSGSVTTLSVGSTATAVPEPATLVLCGIGAMLVASRLRRRQ